MPKRRKSFRKKRPIAVGIIAIAIVVLFLIRLYQVYVPLIQHHAYDLAFQRPLIQGLKITPLGSIVFTGAAYLVLSLAGIIVLIGFLQLRRWSWVMLMAWTGVSLIISLIDYFYSQANYAVMASNVIIAFALNIKEVQRMFKIRSDDEAAL